MDISKSNIIYAYPHPRWEQVWKDLGRLPSNFDWRWRWNIRYRYERETRYVVSIPLYNFNGVIYTAQPGSNWLGAQFIIPLEMRIGYAFVCNKITIIKDITHETPSNIPITIAMQPYCVTHLNENWDPYIPVMPIESSFSKADIGTFPNYWVFVPDHYKFAIPPSGTVQFSCYTVRHIWGDYSFCDIPVRIDIPMEYPHVFRSYYTEFDPDHSPYHVLNNGVMVYAMVVRLNSTSVYNGTRLFFEFSGMTLQNIDFNKELQYRREYLEVSP